MSDENKGNGDDLSGKSLLPAPRILLPNGGAVRRGFTFYATTQRLILHAKWNLDFFRAADNFKLKRYSGGLGVDYVTYQVPDELPTATGLYCKFEYQDSILPVYSDWATSQVFRIIKDTPDPLTAPTITNPGTVRTPRPTLSGTGAGSALVELYEAGVGTIVFASTRAHSLGTWSIELTESLWMADPFIMTARQTLNGETSDWAIPVSFTVLFKPVITSVSVSEERKPTVSGTGGLKGATLEIFLAHSPNYPLFSKILDSTGDWSVIATSAWAPGEHTITAKQSVRKEGSDLAVNKTFLVKPSRPTITSVESDIIHIVRGAGGHQGARLVIWRSGGPPLSKTLGSDGSWWIGDSALWPPGKYDLTAIQYVGSLESETTDVFTVEVKPSAPVINQPPNPSTAKQTLTITQVSSGTVSLQIFTEANASVAGNFTGTGATRTFTPSAEWEVGSTNIKVVQTVNDVPSDPSALVTVVVKPPKPPKPIIEPPPNPTPAKQPLTINAVLPSVAVILQMFTEYNAPVAGEFTGSGATRTFNPERDWRVGAHRVKVVQTVDGVASDPSDVVVFTVNRPKPPKLIIEPPPIPAAARQALTITGILSDVVNMSVFTENSRVPGEFTYSGTIRTFTPQSNWAGGATTVQATQTLDEPSDPSDPVTVTIKPPAPRIIQPPNPAAEKQALTITGVLSGVTLQMFTDANAPVAGAFTHTEPTHTFTPTANWAPGSTTVKVVQSVNTVDSDPSNLVSVVVKPLAPQITTPKEGETHLAVEVQGTCGPGATVKVWSGATDLGATEVVGTNWTNRWLWTPGPKVVHARQTIAGAESDASTVINFKIKPPQPTISPPPNPAAAKQVLTINGVSSGTVTLQMFNNANAPVAGSFSTTGTTRTFTPTANWPLGSTLVKVVQQVNGIESDASSSVNVTVKPLAPIITTPKEGETHLAVEVQGTCEPGATVKVWSGATDLGATEVVGTNWTNRWLWTPGPKVVHARQTIAGAESDASTVIDFKIKPPRPTISPPPNPAAADEALTITEVWPGDVPLQMLTGENAPVAGTFTGSGTTRTFTPTADWADENTVKVVQTVNAVDSDPSEECTFFVEVGEKPEVPHFERPLASGKTSTRPLIRVVGLPGARLTVQRDGAETLHSDNADADGILEFTVETPLTPGETALRVNQKAGGPVSDWSEPHRFTVKELPKTPIIEAPENAVPVPRKPTIRGRGETRGEILLRHANDPQEQIDTLEGVTRWRWTAKEEWPLGSYTIEAQQTDDGDSSQWTDVRSFEVVDALYGIGDSTPVIGNPVVGSGQSVMLRVQVLSGDTGEAAEGVEVQWRIKGQEDVLATTVTEHDGWAYYAYTPETDGKSEVVADITNDNAGVVMTQLYEVNARLQDDWAQEVWLTLGGQNVDLDLRDLVLVAGKTTYLQLTFKDGNHLWGTYVTLQDMWGSAEGLTVVPPLGTPQKVEAPMLFWSISSAEGQSDIFGLRLTSPVLSDWQLPGRVITGDFVQTLDVELDTFPQFFGGEAAYPCLGATHTLTVRPKPDSPIIGLPVLPEFTPEAVDLGVTLRPLVQIMKESGVSWSLDCVNSSKSGNFAMRLALSGWNLNSSEMPMSLGHNKVEITERDGPSQIKERWRYGIRVTSAFSGQPAGDVAVTVSVSGSEDVQRSTQSDGWIYVYYDDGQVVSFTIHNPYDGTTVTG